MIIGGSRAILALDTAGAVAASQLLHFIDADHVIVAFDGVLEAGGCHSEFKGALAVLAGEEAVDKTGAEAVTAADMFEAVTSRSDQMDVIIKAAAVADYTPLEVAGDKIKKSDTDLSIPLARTKDILGWLGEHKKPGQFLCGFSMETRDMLENSRKKLQKKNLDLIAANNVKVPGAGFAGDTNVLTLIAPDLEEELPLLSKDEAAHRLLTVIKGRMNG